MPARDLAGKAEPTDRSSPQIIDHSTPRRWTRRLATQLVRFRWWALVLGLIVFAVTFPASRRLSLDRSISAMFAPGDSALRSYQELQTAFGGNAVAMLVYRDESLMSREGIDRNAKIAQRVAEIPGVQGIVSPSIISEAVERIRPAGLLTGFSKKTPALARTDDVVARGFDALFSGYTHSADHQRAAVVAMLDPDHSPETIRQLKAIATSISVEHAGAMSVEREVALVGEPVLVHDGFDLIERDGARLATLTVVLLSIVVLVSLVDLRFVLLMSVMIVWSITVTKAIMVWCGISLSLVSTILTAIVTVIVVATVLHLGIRFRIARGRGIAQDQASIRALALLMLPIFWTCATDAAGFAALGWSRILPVQQFGWMIAIAAGSVFVAVALFAPSIMMLPNLKVGQGLHQRQRRFARRLRRGCLRLVQWFVLRRRLAVMSMIVIAVIGIAGMLRMKTETSFLRNFRQDSPVAMAYDQVERRFGGAGVWDIILDAPPELTRGYLEQVRELEADLRKIDVQGAQLTKVLSLADADRIAGRAPVLKFAPPTVRLSGMRVTIPVFFDALLTPPDSARPEQPRKLRIMLRSREHLLAEQKTQLIGEVERTVRRHTKSEDWQKHVAGSGSVTGYYVLMSRLVSQLVGDQWRCFFASGLLVWCLLVVATRSFRLATAALVPNLVPIFLVLSALGLSGGKINMGAAMIAAVSIGLSIDGSVHFLASYRRHRAAGHPAQRAAIHAAGNIGVPVLLATIALVIGFSVLASSEFVPTATFGTLVAATLAAGTLINLTLLPASVAWVDQSKSR